MNTGSNYTVVEGNTRIAAYKVLTALMSAPKGFTSVPQISEKAQVSLLNIDCSIAPNRDALLPIMANAHFGLGDKSKWGYLGSRKAVYDEWRSGKPVPKLAKMFDRTQRQVRELILEYRLYQKALALGWSAKNKAVLLNPALEFNPPVRFLQTSGHKEKLGIKYDEDKLKIVFSSSDAKKRFKHLVEKLVIAPQKGLGATAKYDAVFSDFKGKQYEGASVASAGITTGAAGTSGHSSGGGSSANTSSTSSGSASGSTSTKPDTLFSYPVTQTNALVVQLMKEAKELNFKKYPASATFLLRNIVEAILKHIIDQQKANPASKTLDLEGAINLCCSSAVTMGTTERKILKEFKDNHLNYLNLGSHANIIPHPDRVAGARDCIDQFIKKNV